MLILLQPRPSYLAIVMGYFNISFSIFLLALAPLVITCSQVTSSSYQDLSLPVQSQEHQETESCLHQHFSALLHLKRGFRFTYDSVTNLSSWNPENRDCCTWEGITCDTSTGHVIAIDLSELEISGQMDFQTLSLLGGSLHILNLAFNDFDPSLIPSAIGQLQQLTYLNLSSSNFGGQIPVEMSSLTRLVSLDLSSDIYFSNSLKLEKPSFGALVQNMSGLRELILDRVGMPSDQEWSRTISSSLPNLRKLSMSDCSLSGPVHPSFSHLRFLSQLDLSSNILSCAELDFVGNLSSLTSLRLAFCHGGFSGKNLSWHNLSELDLSGNDISPAVLEKFIANSSSLTSLSLAFCGLDGRHFDRILTLPCLSKLDLSYNDFSSVKPDFASNVSSFKSLTELDLGSCNISGPLPSHLANFTRLELLDLSFNAFSGTIPSSYGVDLLNLRTIHLFRNLLNGTIPSSLFSLPSLTTLALERNRFGGQLDEFHNASSSPLDHIDLSQNMLQGMIPRSIFQLMNLTYLNLYSNNFSDIVNLDLFLNVTRLSYLALSHVNISVKDSTRYSASMSLPQLLTLSFPYCNLKRFPNFLRNQERLGYLDLSGNKIEGEIPPWIWKLGNGNIVHLNLSYNALQTIQTPVPNISLSHLISLDLSCNVLEGLLPVPLSPFFTFYSVSANRLSGKIPVSVCNLTYLEVLDLSENNFSGPIPQCFSEMSNVLIVLNLRRNAFSGRLFQTVKQDCSLKILDLSENQFEGQLPSSLVNCRGLFAIHVGDNHIHGPFPSWIQQMANLQILILRSNYFYGPIKLPPRKKNFSSMLQIIDLSFNRFNGSLPSTIFLAWKGMRRKGESTLEYLSGNIEHQAILMNDALVFYEPIIVKNKNLKMNFQKVPAMFALVDFSSNYFEGQIPKSIGILKSLQVLNMSHNGFTGHIPRSMKNLMGLESLDLSQNSLSGYIPQELLQLTFLQVLNLSNNQFIGPIPQAKQFSTFTNESFQGNLGLCGPPLTKACEETERGSPSTFEDPDFEPESEYDWKIIAIGFGIGYGVGMGAFYWTLGLWRRGRRAYNKLVYKVLLVILPSVA